MIGRRAILTAGPLALLARKRRRQPVGWKVVDLVTPLVIVSGPTGSPTGVFVYAAGTTPAAGNPPIASITNQTADPFGNAVTPTVAAYATVSGDRYAALLNAFTASIVGGIAAAAFTDLTHPPFVSPSFGGFANPTFGSEAVMSSGIGVSGGGQSGVVAADSQRSGVTGGLVSVVAGVLTVQGGNLVAFVGGGLETWHPMAAGLAAGFADVGAPFAAAGYQLEPIGGGRVRLRGRISLTANEAANTTFFTLPVGYRPAFESSYTTPNSAGATAVVQVLATGALQIASAFTLGQVFQLDGIVIELD